MADAEEAKMQIRNALYGAAHYTNEASVCQYGIEDQAAALAEDFTAAIATTDELAAALETAVGATAGRVLGWQEETAANIKQGLSQFDNIPTSRPGNVATTAMNEYRIAVDRDLNSVKALSELSAVKAAFAGLKAALTGYLDRAKLVEEQGRSRGYTSGSISTMCTEEAEKLS